MQPEGSSTGLMESKLRLLTRGVGVDARSEDKGQLERDRVESLRNWVFIYKTFIFFISYVQLYFFN